MDARIIEKRVQVGLQLPIQSQSTLFAEEWENSAGADELAAVAEAADLAGFDYIAVCDHIAIPEDMAEAMGSEWWDTIATLGWLAGITRQIKLMSHVYVPVYRHPLQVAKAFSTLDVVSRGRMILGLGAGHVEGEFEALGVDFAGRGPVLDERIRAIRDAFGDEYTEAPKADDGTQRVAQKPRPVQAGGPPIWVGGSSRSARRRAALLGDGWLPQGPITRETVEELLGWRDEAGLEGPFMIGALLGGVFVGEDTWDFGRPTLSGTPEQIAEVILDTVELGAGQVQVQLRSRSVGELLWQLHVFGDEVLPLLGDEAATERHGTAR